MRMHGCASGSLLLVNAGVDSMGGVIDGGVEFSSAPSSQQSSDLEKTQAELRYKCCSSLCLMVSALISSAFLKLISLWINLSQGDVYGC